MAAVSLKRLPNQINLRIAKQEAHRKEFAFAFFGGLLLLCLRFERTRPNKEGGFSFANLVALFFPLLVSMEFPVFICLIHSNDCIINGCILSHLNKY